MNGRSDHVAISQKPGVWIVFLRPSGIEQDQIPNMLAMSMSQTGDLVTGVH